MAKVKSEKCFAGETQKLYYIPVLSSRGQAAPMKLYFLQVIKNTN
jgi:hypothetical protein